MGQQVQMKQWGESSLKVCGFVDCEALECISFSYCPSCLLFHLKPSITWRTSEYIQVFTYSCHTAFPKLNVAPANESLSLSHLVYLYHGPCGICCFHQSHIFKCYGFCLPACVSHSCAQFESKLSVNISLLHDFICYCLQSLSIFLSTFLNLVLLISLYIISIISCTLLYECPVCRWRVLIHSQTPTHE